MNEHTDKFIDELARSLREKTFVKMTLGNYKGTDKHLQKIHVREIETKKGQRLFFLYRYDTRDTAKNFDHTEGCRLVAEMLGVDFFSGHLFTVANDFQLDIGKNGKARLNVAKPTFKSRIVAAHDREKKRPIDPNSSYLRHLGITTDLGEIRRQQEDKWRQINSFVETVAKLVEKSQLKGRSPLRIVDMGSGKGYLTFALFDHFKNHLGIDVQVTGVDTKSELIGLCNDIARASEFDGLSFVNGSIDSYEIGEVDILIALHACNTATDDAIYKGMMANAELIIAAPCCHQEIRPQIDPPPMFRNILKHGVMLERTAESVTDGLRALLLEREGYAAKLFEFISVEHTPKNNMLVGTRLGASKQAAEIDQEIRDVKEFYGIREQRLEKLLENRRSVPHGTAG